MPGTSVRGILSWLDIPLPGGSNLFPTQSLDFVNGPFPLLEQFAQRPGTRIELHPINHIVLICAHRELSGGARTLRVRSEGSGLIREAIKPRA